MISMICVHMHKLTNYNLMNIKTFIAVLIFAWLSVGIQGQTIVKRLPAASPMVLTQFGIKPVEVGAVTRTLPEQYPNLYDSFQKMGKIAGSDYSVLSFLLNGKEMFTAIENPEGVIVGVQSIKLMTRHGITNGMPESVLKELDGLERYPNDDGSVSYGLDGIFYGVADGVICEIMIGQDPSMLPQKDYESTPEVLIVDD